MCIFRLVLKCLLVARKENLIGVSTGLTGRSKNLDRTSFHLCIDVWRLFIQYLLAIFSNVLENTLLQGAYKNNRVS